MKLGNLPFFCFCLACVLYEDPMDLFVHEFYKPGAEEGSLVTITVEGFKAENGQQLNSTGTWRIVHC